ncbi:MAG: repeat-associated core domain protein [Herbaspirillum sp.]|nr:repeat-associated core domain protein [Herbaspirillum sp.]
MKIKNNVNAVRYAGSVKDGGSTALAQSLSKVEKEKMDAGFVGRSQTIQHDVERRKLKHIAGGMAAALIRVVTNNNDGRSSDDNALSHAIVKKGKSLFRKLNHHAHHGADRLRRLAASRTGSFTLPQPYAPSAALRTPKDFERLGLRSEEAAVFQELAAEKNWDIFVRTGTSTRTINVGCIGVRPKPGGMYRKTSKDAVHPGLVSRKASEVEEGCEEVDTINHPPQHAPFSLQVLAEEGFHWRAIGADILGMRDQAGNFIYGDIDIHGVYARQPDGSFEKIPASIFVPLFNERLMATGLHGPELLESTTLMKEKEYGVLPYSPVQHGAHDEWTERNNEDYAEGINMGPLPGVIHFSDDAPYYIATVPQYRDVLKSFNRDKEYVGPAWSNGCNRLADAHYRKLL